MIEKEISNNNENNIDPNNKFTIQYTKEELDKIQIDFLEQISNYIARINNHVLRTLQEIEKEAAIELEDDEVEVFPPTTTNEETEEDGDKII